MSTRGRRPPRKQGAKFASGLGAADLAALRAKTTDEVLQAALKGQWFSPIIDGYVLPKTAAEIYAAGEHNARAAAGGLERRRDSIERHAGAGEADRGQLHRADAEAVRPGG